ncbi:hypothetical protein LCGC14_1898110 [marine sediment metagenome]|uniref:Uncharacterized protein n=1 Tax=marine sediment metagenome TaxID=412755 RepID=A0A0F9GKS4_9ZZZZ
MSTITQDRDSSSDRNQNLNTEGIQLHKLTALYWKVSSAFNRGKPQITTEAAIKDLNEILYNTNPCRPISQKAASLQNEIIVGNSTEEGV